MRPLIVLLCLPALAACVPDGAERADPASDYATFCASCHGASGRGDGPLAASLGGSLERPPADLTRIAARNGGVFPTTRVMSQIDGFTRNRHGGGGPMPEFGYILEGRNVLYDDGTGGNPVPVPERLLALAGYLASLQRN